MTASNDQTISAQIIALEKRRCGALIANNMAALQKLVSDDLVYTHGSGVVDDKTVYLAAQRAKVAIYETIDHEDLRVRAYHSNVAILTGRLRLAIKVKGEPRSVDDRFTSVWVRSDRETDDWQFVSFQATPNRTDRR